MPKKTYLPDLETQIYLIDNGSLAPAATFQLRELASALGALVNKKVKAVSLLHSHKISAEALQGIPATIVKRQMREDLAAGHRHFILLPLFLGPSRALSDYLPVVLEELKSESGEFTAVIAEPLAGGSVSEPDSRLAVMLADRVHTADPSGTMQIALVDHGTPAREVNTLRNSVAAQISTLLGRPVVAASMERREGPEFAFNEPLLEDLDKSPGMNNGALLAAMFFLLPGRHAGDGGDVAQIGEALVERGAFAQVARTVLLGGHPILLEILADRLAATVTKIK
jgi:hypothetical protein